MFSALRIVFLSLRKEFIRHLSLLSHGASALRIVFLSLRKEFIRHLSHLSRGVSMYGVIAKIALASLNRRRARTLLIVLMIATSLWGLLLIQGLYEGMTEQMIDNAIRSDSGDITLYSKGYRLENDISKLIKNSAVISDVLLHDSRVKSFVKRIKHDGLIATAKYSRMAKIYGVDLEAERVHGRLHEYLRVGEYSFGKRGRGVIVGAALAKKLHVRVGKKVVITAQSVDNEVVAVALKVVGIFKTNNMALDDFGVFMDIKRAKSFLDIEKGATQISVILQDENRLSTIQEELKQQFSSLEVFRWDELYPALLQSRGMMEIFSYVMYFLVFCVASLGIFGVVLVSVLERTREFGMMLAIGSQFSLICQIVLFESFLLGLLGFVSGSLLGGGTLYYFHTHGLDLSSFSAGLEEFGIDAIIYSVIKPQYFILAFFSVLSATLLSIILPLRVLKQSRPIQVIHKI